jgi:hypothetical protein
VKPKTAITLLVLTLWLSLGVQTSRTQQPVDFATVEAFLKQTLTRGDSLTVDAKGDLNGDGVEDWAGVILREKSDVVRTSQLYVLLQQTGGGYRVAEKSREEQVAGMGCCWTEDLKITRSSIYIQNNAKTAATMEAATHQFKLYKNEWRLVGVKIYYIDRSTDITTETDMNILTGAVIEKKWKGQSQPTTKRRQKAFGRFLLRDFDFFNGFGVQ